MKYGVDSKRVEENALARFGRSIANIFKTTKREVEKPEPAGPSINPEALTAQKREWIDSQAAQVQQALATWPEHLFEHFFVVGLPPDIEVTRIAEDLWAQEVRQRQDGGEQDTGASAVAGAAGGGGGSSSSTIGGTRASSKPRQYDKAPRPAYDAQVLFRHPAVKTAPLSDQELVDLCFPHKVTPVKLHRSPSMSSLHEVVCGRHAAARDDQCFIFLLKVGTRLPLYGVCCAVPEVLHRPPHLARHLYPACRMPFRSVMIAAPRVYCLLSHYPFFDLHFQVLNVILGMERLHRTVDFNAELDCSALSSAAAAGSAVATTTAITTAAATAARAVGTIDSTAASSAGGGAACASADGKALQPLAHSNVTHPQQPQTPQQQQQQRGGAVRLSSRSYCHDCANAIVDIYPGLLHTREPRHLRCSRPSVTGLLLEEPWVLQSAEAAAEAALMATGRGLPLVSVPGGTGLAAIRTHGSVRRVSDPGSAGVASPRLDLGPATTAGLATAVDLRQNRRRTSNGGGATSCNGGGGSGGTTAVVSPGGRWLSDGGLHERGPPRFAEMECCQACGRMLGWAPLPRPTEEMPIVPEQSLQEEATNTSEVALDSKVPSLPGALTASLNEGEAAAAALLLRRNSPGPGGGSAAAGIETSTRCASGLQVAAPGDSATAATDAGSGDFMDTSHGPPCLCVGSFLSSDMGTPNAALTTDSAASMTARTLLAAPAEAVTTLALVVRESLKALSSGAISAGSSRRRGCNVEDAAAGTYDTSSAVDADAAAVELADGFHIQRGRPEHAAFINALLASPLQSQRSTHPPHSEGQSGVASQPLGSRPTALVFWNSSTVLAGRLDINATNRGSDHHPPESLVQQLMRSVMAPPLSPVQAPIAASVDAPVPCSPTGRGQGLPSGVHSTIQSPVLPASPRQDQQQQQQQKLTGRGRSISYASHVSSAIPGGAMAAAGFNHGWSFLQRLGRRSQCRSAGGDLFPGLGRDDKGEMSRGCELPREEVPASPSAGAGASDAFGMVAAARLHDRYSGDGAANGARYSGMESAFATAIDLAETEEQQTASPRTPLPYSAPTDAAAAAVVTPATRTLDGSRPEPQVPVRFGEAIGPAGSRVAAANTNATGLPPLPPSRVTGSPGGYSPEPASQYASMPHSGPASRRVTVPGDGLQGNDAAGGTGNAGASTVASGSRSGSGAAADRCGHREGDGGGQVLQRRQLTVAAAALFAAAPHLQAEQSGISTNPSDISFYSAEGAEEACSPRTEAGTASAPPPEALTAWRPSPFQVSRPLAQTLAASASQVPDMLSDHDLVPMNPLDYCTSVDLSPSHDVLRGNGAVTPHALKLRGPTSLQVSLLGPPLSAPGVGSCGAGGTVGGGGRGSLSNTPSVAAPGPSRLARTSASHAQDTAVMGTTSATAAQPVPLPPATHVRSSVSTGGAAVAAAIPQSAAQGSLHGSGGMVSPPPAGVVVTSDMAHHFSPRHALDQLYSHPLVHPGEQITLHFGGVATLQFTRPVLGRRYTVLGPPRAIQAYAEAELAEGLQHWTTAVLCRSLSLDNLLLVLTAVLLERQVVVFCPHISVLSGCVLGLLPLLRPFFWQSLLLPVTPASMMGFLEAPVPFVLGVQYKTSDVMARCAHLIRVNVYKDQVKNAGAALPQLPGLKRLIAALAPYHAVLRRRLAHPAGDDGTGAGGSSAAGTAAPVTTLGTELIGTQADVQQDGGRSLRSLNPAEITAASNFLSVLAQHLGSLCGDLRPHVITNVGLSKRTGVLMKESLLEVIQPKDKPFVRQFVETQLFSVWSDALISANFEGCFAAAN